jgi:ribonuclease-3
MTSAEHRKAELVELTFQLGIHLSDYDLLDRALTHASIASEAQEPTYDYESLEFLGDAALGLAVAHFLFQHIPDRTPGEYSRMRAAVVNRRTLARVAQALHISPLIRLGKGEELSGGRDRAALQADCLEALIGALYIDQGWTAARAFVEKHFKEEFERAQSLDMVWDYKSRLQHACQTIRLPLPVFILVHSEGPDHQKQFEVEVQIDGQAAGRGTGLSKKEAEQNAARVALENQYVKIR